MRTPFRILPLGINSRTAPIQSRNLPVGPVNKHLRFFWLLAGLASALATPSWGQKYPADSNWPVITSPQGKKTFSGTELTVCEGQSVTFTLVTGQNDKLIIWSKRVSGSGSDIELAAATPSNTPGIIELILKTFGLSIPIEYNPNIRTYRVGGPEGVQPSDAGTYYATIYGGDLLSPPTLYFGRTEITLTVKSKPVVGSATASPNPVCLDGTLNLQANVTEQNGNDGEETPKYSWSGPDGFTATTTDNPLVRPLASAVFEGVYSVKFTDSYGCTSAEASTTPVVLKLPEFGPATVPPNTAVCANQILSIGISTKDCPLPADNVFKIELSDKNGSFVNPIVLPGTLGASQVTSQPTTVTAKLPLVLATGYGYRARVVSSRPVLTSQATEPFIIYGLEVAPYPTTPGKLCQRGVLPVTFGTLGNCPFPDGNVFTVQLSNAFGTFSNPTVLGTAPVGTTNFTLPTNLPAGTGYRVRILSSYPPTTSVVSLPFQLEAPSLAVTPTVGNAPVCRGGQVTVSFNLPAGGCPFFDGNQFTAQLSSATGSFNNPTTLGAVTPGQANSVTIPVSAASGTGYRIRIVSSNPVVTSANSTPFQVKVCASRLSVEAAELVIRPNPVVGGEIRCRATGMDNPEFSLTTATGRNLSLTMKTDGSGEFVLTPKQRLGPGVYVLQASEGTVRLTRRVLVVE